MPYLLWQYLTESAHKFPSRPAVASAGKILTYRELEEQSNCMARFLRAKGIGAGTRVGLYLPKSIHSVVAMLGILKVGAAYVPMDPQAPGRRVAFIMDNCQISGLVSTSRKLAGMQEHLKEVDCLKTVLLCDQEDNDMAPAASVRLHRWAELADFAGDSSAALPAIESDPAYLLYTSGSTGNPKGVIISHRNAITFVEWAGDTFCVQPDDRLSNHAPLHFDLSVFDIYAALRAGACVVLVPDEIAPFPFELGSWIQTEKISVWYSVPSALVRLLLHGNLDRFAFDSLRTILFAGEVFPVKYLRELMTKLRHVAFYNLYGPTETNVCTYYKVSEPPSSSTEAIPIGRACANTDTFAVDEKGHRVPAGEPGELFVRGPSVMLGYWGLPDKTSQTLLVNPLQSAYEARVYRTGDFVRESADGNFMFLGRRDNMVKSRGYRIELGEVEHVLYQHPVVREAVVVAIPDEEVGARLKAVVVAHNAGGVTSAGLESFCVARLPKYMVPEAFIFRPDLPKTSTGKADRVAIQKDLQDGERKGQTP